MSLSLRSAAAAVCMVLAFPGPGFGLQSDVRTRAALVLEVPVSGDSSVFLQRPVGATRFDSGVLAVADGLGQTVHYFNAAGQYLRSVGRAGEGPGEFSTPGWLGRCGSDAALVWDFSLMRLTRLDQSGAIIEQRNLRDLVDLPRPPARMACSRTGQILTLLRLGGERIRHGDVSVLTAPLYSFTPGQKATLIDPAARVIEWLNRERVYRPVSPTTYFAVSESGIFIAPSDSALVHVLGVEGAPRETWPLQLQRREPTDEHVRRDAETQTAFISDVGARSQVIDRILSLPRPPSLPFHSGLHVDELGRLWVVTSFPGDALTTLRAYDVSGSLLGEVEIPVGIDVYEVGGHHVVGGREDLQSLEPKVMVFSFDLVR